LTAAVVIGGVLMLGMVAVAWHAARVLPAGARVPLNVGVPEYSLWLPKAAGLAVWLAAGVVTFAAVAAVTLDSLAASWATSLRVVLLPCAMLVVLSAQAGAVIYARRYPSGPVPVPGDDRVPPPAGASAEASSQASGDAT